MPARRYLQSLASQRYEGEIYNRFMESLEQIAGDVDISKVVLRIERGDIEGAIDVLDITEGRFDEVRSATAGAMAAGGAATMAAFPPVQRDGKQVKITFNKGSRRAVQAVDDLHTDMIREVTGGTRGAIRDYLRNGLERGVNPRTMARGIRGRYDYQAKTFRGGVLGLTKNQNQWVMNAEAQLRSADPTELRKYLGRKLRDKRYDRSVLKAINEGTAVPDKIITNATYAYRRKATQYRAETIARDQSIEALSQGQDVACDQAIQEGAVRDQDILQQWEPTSDERTREFHAVIPSMNPGGVRRGEYFETPLGAMLRPRDRGSPGGVPENTIQCRCSLSVNVRRQ